MNCKLSKFLKLYKKKIYTDLDVFFTFFKNKCITITGTNGKSTTAKILYEVLKDQKKDVRLIGNIGNPPLNEKKISKNTIFVIEASSYQLDYSQLFSSKYSIILNIKPDHLERHKTLQNYVDAKFKLLDSQSKSCLAFVKSDDVLISRKLKTKKFKKTNKIVIIREAIIIPLTLINAFLGFVIFFILSPLYNRFKPPHTNKGIMMEI